MLLLGEHDEYDRSQACRPCMQPPEEFRVPQHIQWHYAITATRAREAHQRVLAVSTWPASTSGDYRECTCR